MSTITIYRVTKQKYLDGVIDGDGARSFPGRWNNRGVPMVYCAATRSLALLELLVHLEDYDLIEEHYGIVPIEIPTKTIQDLTEELPANWMDSPVPDTTRAIGSNWVKRGSALVLKSPSVIIPLESNYLINPSHKDVKLIKVHKMENFYIDRRL